MHLPFTPRLPPMSHQLRVLAESGRRAEFALFWDQGTGKTKEFLDQFALLACEGAVDCALLIAPNGVHRNWVSDEIPKHWPTDAPQIDAHAWSSAKAGSRQHKAVVEYVTRPHPPKVRLLAMSYDQLMTEAGKQAAWDMMRLGKCMLGLDESQRVKTPNAKRTKRVLAMGPYAKYRRIMSGTPVTNGPLDIYSQVRFLDPDFWMRIFDVGTFTAFKHRFATWQSVKISGGASFDKLIAYRDLELLYEAIATMSDRVLKEDVLDLPPKVYQTRYHELTPQQTKAYHELRDEYVTLTESGEPITAEMAMVRLLRFQQVCCGFLPDPSGEGLIRLGNPNPRTKLLIETLEDLTRPVIIWGRFRNDIREAEFASRMAGRVPVIYDGSVDEAARMRALEMFHAGEAQDFIANPAAAATGLTLVEADTTIYYSNSYNLEHRLQSEDRNHRIGQNRSVTYIDLLSDTPVDVGIIQALRAKRNLSGEVLGEQLKEWLS